MKKIQAYLSRRKLLQGLAAIPVIAILGHQSRAEAEMLSVDDPIAKNFRYTETSTNVDGQICSNCKLYTGGTAPTGGCSLFGAKQVVAGGWCTAWLPK
jgi:hypothetical protein